MLFYSNLPGPRNGPANTLMKYLGLVLLVVFLIGNGIIPRCLPARNGHVKEITSLISSVPMNRSSRAPNNISDIQFLRFAALIADPARSSCNLEDLSLFVVVPMCPGAGSKHDVIDRDSLLFVGEDGVGPDVTGECGPSQFRFLTRGAGVANDCHRHVESEIERFVGLNEDRIGLRGWRRICPLEGRFGSFMGVGAVLVGGGVGPAPFAKCQPIDACRSVSTGKRYRSPPGHSRSHISPSISDSKASFSP